MLVGGEYPAPSALAPRLMDNLLLSGNANIIFAVGLAMLKSKQRKLLTLKADQLVIGLKQLPQTCANMERLMLQALELQLRVVGKSPGVMKSPVGVVEKDPAIGAQ